MADKQEQLIENAIGRESYIGLKRLDKALTEEHSKPNIIQLSEFIKFADIFKTPTFENTDDLSSEELSSIVKLSKEFMSLIDLYRPTEIRSGEKVVLTLPATFTATSTISKDRTEFVDVNIKFGDSDVPKYRAEAFANMFKALMDSQFDDKHLNEIKKRRNEFDKLTTEFNNMKAGRGQTAVYQHADGAGMQDIDETTSPIFDDFVDLGDDDE